MSRIQAGCEDLLSAYRAKGRDPEMGSPLSDSEISELTKWFPIPLPEELRELYRWHNGQPKDAWNSEAIYEFRDMQFTSLERAGEEYSSMMETYGVENSREIDGVDLATCFPFASFNGGWFVYPCDGQEINHEHEAPIISVLQGIDVYFYSLEAMLETCIDWIKASSISKDFGRELPEITEMSIWRRHNPGIFEPSEGS